MIIKCFKRCIASYDMLYFPLAECEIETKAFSDSVCSSLSTRFIFLLSSANQIRNKRFKFIWWAIEVTSMKKKTSIKEKENIKLNNNSTMNRHGSVSAFFTTLVECDWTHTHTIQCLRTKWSNEHLLLWENTRICLYFCFSFFVFFLLFVIVVVSGGVSWDCHVINQKKKYVHVHNTFFLVSLDWQTKIVSFPNRNQMDKIYAN